MIRLFWLWLLVTGYYLVPLWRINRLRQAVQLHERNVEALRKEIAAIR